MGINLSVLLLTLSTALAQPTLPRLPAPPPQTNRYWLKLAWNCPTDFCTVSWGTNSGQYPYSETANGTNHVFSNLLYGAGYVFAESTNCIERNAEFVWPPAQLPLTNTVTIGCTGPLQMKLLGLNSAWVDVTNKVFRLRQDQSYYWRSKARETLTIAMSNNQVNYGQFMHRQ